MMINALGYCGHHLCGDRITVRAASTVCGKGAGACMVVGAVMTAIVSAAAWYSLGPYLRIDLFTTDPQVQEIGIRACCISWSPP